MLLKVQNLKKEYRRGTHRIEAIRGVDLSINKGEFVSIMGPSGSGKSTLLQMVGALDKQTSGEVFFDGQRIEALSDSELARFRRQKLGFVFQFFHLLPGLSALENTVLPLLLDGKKFDSVKDRGLALLEKVGLKGREHHVPAHLSGGQMQRVAIARALVANPILVLADEPTGSLDSATSQEILELFQKLCREHQQTVVMVTHNEEAARFGTRVIRLRDGKIESDGAVGHASSVRAL